MNKKGKNKKGKVPIPNPSHEEKLSEKVEDLGVIGDKRDAEKTSVIIENLEEKIESVKEERVPEIVSEILTPSVDTKDEETPKKPKRNRGKKKKGKEDDFDDNLEEISKESAIQPAVEETKTPLEVEKEQQDSPIVTPTARKKKNKKKNLEEKIEEPVLPKPELALPPLTIKDLNKEPGETPITQETILQPETVEQEMKPSKKKNKKKKRTDSEKSDKEEISCTTAFQKLVEAMEEDPLELKMQGKNYEIIPIEGIKLETEIKPPKDTLIQDTIVEKESVTLAEIMPLEEKETQQMPVTESKSKKKNKKDKKHILSSEESHAVLDKPITEPPSLPVQEMPTENLIKKEVSKDTVEIENPTTLVEETSPKPKAKIAKPVEKKRKGKQDDQGVETLPQDTIIVASPKVEDLFPEVVLECPEIKDSEKEIICEPKNIPQNTPDDSNIPTTFSDQLKQLSLQEFESLNVTDRAMGKKRKKGPKIPKTPDVSFEILDPKLEADTKLADAEIFDVSKEVPITSQSATMKEQEVSITGERSEVPGILGTPTDTKPTVEPATETQIKEHILLTPEVMVEKDIMKTDTSVAEKAENTQTFETKSGKKRKKSPKPPKKAEAKPETDEQSKPAPKPSEECPPKSEVTKEMGEKIDASNITKMYDIEISSIKVEESEGSVCDTVPDITYPRASSQQLSDDNNNTTVIREIFPVQEIIPQIPVPESMKTKTADSISTEKEHNVSPSKEEKTDIKSKMMEVNQDMEELRLSIERSLAELTAIEKNEEVVEKSFEDNQMKTKDNVTEIKDVDTLQKRDEHEKMAQISDAEKSALEKPLERLRGADDIKNTKEQKGEHLILKDDKLTPVDTMLQVDLRITNPSPEKKDLPPIDSKIAEVTPKETKTTEPIIDTKIDSETPTTSINPLQALLSDIILEKKSLSEKGKTGKFVPVTPHAPPVEMKLDQVDIEKKETETKPEEEGTQIDSPPICPARKDNKSKHKKKKGKQDSQITPPTQTQPTPSVQSSTTSQSSAKEAKKEEKTENKTQNKSDSKEAKGKGKQQASANPVTEKDDMDYEPIENFEDALTSSVDDVNKTFEIIVKESQAQFNPKINIIAPDEEKSPVSPPKNLLGHPDIPVQSSKRDYKKEKDKIPNEITAKVDIKDSVEVERKQTKNTQTINKLKDFKDCRMSDNEEFVYKYSFRRVFLQSSCHMCKKDLAGARVACCYCNLVFYCGIKHKDEDWPQHQALCFAVSTIGHLKDQKHIYADVKNITGHDYRLVRMQMIVSCEKVLKRRLVPWEQESLLYPRMCAHVPCREWRQMKLSDCQGCGQISFCTKNPDHYPKSHSRWCKSYNLYQKLVCYQQTKGRLEPRLPTKVMKEQYTIPEKINEVLAAMYEEKIDMNGIQYAALTQLATAPLTAAYCHQLYRSKITTANGYKMGTFTIHVVGAELQFEADALNKWEVFFLHLRPDLQELRVVLVNYNLNPSNLPLELLGRIKLCEDCRQNKRRVIFDFQDKRTYADYKSSEEFVVPDIVCAFNPSIQRSSVYNGKDPWPSTVNAIVKQKIPFIVTAYTITELHKDCIRIKECSETEYNFISEPKYNNFASVRPDRNFISDDEMPLLFKNYCFAIICG